MINQKQQGFSALIIVLLIALVGVIGFVGWRMYDANQQAAQQQATQNPENVQPTETATYLDIKELRIKIKLDDNTKDISYNPDSSENGQITGVTIISELLKANDEKLCFGPNFGQLGRIDKTTNETFGSASKKLVVDNETVFKIDEYFYVFRQPQAECTQNTEIGAQRGIQRQEFLNALKTIQAY